MTLILLADVSLASNEMRDRSQDSTRTTSLLNTNKTLTLLIQSDLWWRNIQVLMLLLFSEKICICMRMSVCSGYGVVCSWGGGKYKTRAQNFWTGEVENTVGEHCTARNDTRAIRCSSALVELARPPSRLRLTAGRTPLQQRSRSTAHHAVCVENRPVALALSCADRQGRCSET